MSDNKRSGDRRKDYVTKLAIGLFAFIIIFEILLVTWLPHQLVSQSLWSKEVAMQELIDLEDLLRKRVKHSLKFQNKWQEGEANMALDCMNQIAKYLRKNQTKMSQDQIHSLYSTLQKFEVRYNQWADNRYCITFETIDIQPLLQTSLDKYNNDTNKQSELKKDHILFQD